MLDPSFREQLKADIEQYVEQLFAANPKEELVYHSIHHTRSVVKHSLEIARATGLNEDEVAVLFTIAWFHDTGHLFADQKNHEEASVQVANKFLNNYPQIPSRMFAEVERGILATKMPQLPCTPVEDVICDADTYHLATLEFFVTDELVKREVALKGGNTVNWNQSTLRMMEAHEYHTAYCQKRLEGGKRYNINFLKDSTASR